MKWDSHDWRTLWNTGVCVGVLLLCGGVVWSGVGFVMGMKQSHDAIEATKVPTPEDLAQGVHTSMGSLAAGAVLGGLGASVLALSLVAKHTRREGVEDRPA